MDDEKPQAGGEIDENSADGLRAYLHGDHPEQRAKRAYIASKKGDHSLLAAEIALWNPYLKEYRAEISEIVARAPAVNGRPLKSLPAVPRPELFAAALAMFEARACGVDTRTGCIALALKECGRRGAVTETQLEHLWKDRAKFWRMWDAHPAAFADVNPVIFLSALKMLRAIYIVSQPEGLSKSKIRDRKKQAVAAALRSRQHKRSETYGQLCDLAAGAGMSPAAVLVTAERELDSELRLDLEGRLEL